MLKTALIAGGELWERVAAGAEPDAEIVFACARTKLEVVAADERDGGRRQVLNLGHTVGHAIETATGYERYRHGEAVGLGLLAALRLSGQDELRAQVHELLAARGLPVRLAGVEVEAVLEALSRDKKRAGTGGVPFVLVKAPGEVSEGHHVPAQELRAAVEELIAMSAERAVIAGPARRQPRPARPPRPGALRDAHAGRARSHGGAGGPRARARGRVASRPTTRGPTSSGCTPRAARLPGSS